MNEVLALRGVKKSYNLGQSNQVDSLHHVDFTLARGEIVGLVGPSGAGKSTLLHICGLLDNPDAGEVEFLGQNLHNASDIARTRARRNDIGFIYQFHHLLPEFDAVENLLIPQLAAGLNYKIANQRAQELLVWAGLADRATHRPSQLSGGEQQRVAICRAMCNTPYLVLADEPTGNLDPRTSDYVFEMLLSLVRNTGLSALIATHNLELALRMDRRVTLQNGILVPY